MASRKVAGMPGEAIADDGDRQQHTRDSGVPSMMGTFADDVTIVVARRASGIPGWRP